MEKLDIKDLDFSKPSGENLPKKDFNSSFFNKVT
jgi:hypothetical protein